MDARMAGQIFFRRLPHHRGEMDRIDQLHLPVALRQTAQRRHDVLHGRPVIFPSVARHQDHFFSVIVQFIEKSC